MFDKHLKGFTKCIIDEAGGVVDATLKLWGGYIL